MRNPHFYTKEGFIRFATPSDQRAKPVKRDLSSLFIALFVLCAFICAGTLDSWADPANQTEVTR